VDRQATFTQLYREHYDSVLCYAARRTDADTARDIAAETFLVAWRRLAAVPQDPRFVRPWLYGVARRVLSNAERSRRRAGLLAAHLQNQHSAPDHVRDLADSVASQMQLDQALQRLTERDREVLRLIGWEELDICEAALAMGCTRAAMAVRLHRARRRLALALQATEQPSAAAAVGGK